ncbi:PAS domain-containing sensor histidine kinase [Paraglaciecola sp. L3A3]|uniref:sensor histidine kinase n=1 Tax=Paraglaciecola sp. L3A3 TaxID=2686358 RepID=UPI00131B8704|nr:PAS domain-containing sensor histidine kinase [Paraglaciecola sp. L3A3]
MAILYTIWSLQNAYPPISFIFSDEGTLMFYLSIVILFSTLFVLFVHQSMKNSKISAANNDNAEQLKTLLQNLPGTAYRVVINPSKEIEVRVEFLSDACFSLTGYKASYIIDGHISLIDLIDSADRDDVIKWVNDAVYNNKMYDFECRINTKSGLSRWVWHRGRSVGVSGNNEVCIEGFVCDITARKQAELALKETQAFSEALVDTAIEAVITINSTGMITSFNRSAETMFGYSKDYMQSNNIILLVPQFWQEQETDIYNVTANISTARLHTVGKETNALKKDGMTFPVKFSVSEVPAQKTPTFVVSIRDISQQRAAEDEARIHRDQLAYVDRLNALGEMASGIAHEINQPLAAISLFAQAGKRLLDSGDDKRVPEIFDKLSLHTQRAGAIIERLQLMTRQNETKKQAANCHKLVTEVIKLAEAESRIYDIEIEANIAKKLPIVMVDTVQIQQVILNLLRNAINSMRAIICRNGNVITIRVSESNQNDSVVFAVIDRGNGISQNEEKHLFQPFASTNKTGMGMGLSISRAIIEAHQGHINFLNNTDNGATFYFTLPTTKQET